MRTTKRWTSLPGSIDVLHQSEHFQVENGDNEFGFPYVGRFNGDLEKVAANFVFYKERKNVEASKSYLHFFADDFNFEVVWSKPNTAVKVIKKFAGAASPDFSVYPHWAKSANIWNIYRSRWVGAFWQVNGVDVIPTVTWADADSFHYCFEGLPEEAALALELPDIRQLDAQLAFLSGFRNMLHRLGPTKLLVYGRDVMEVLATEVYMAGFGTELVFVPKVRPRDRIKAR